MLAVESLRPRDDQRDCGSDSFSTIGDDFPDFSSSDNLLESINFDDIFDGMEYEEHVLPALEIMDPDCNDDDCANTPFIMFDQTSVIADVDNSLNIIIPTSSDQEEEVDKAYNNISGSGLRSSGLTSSSSSLNNQGEEIVSKRGESNLTTKKGGRKSSKDHQAKRKVKVDWTPELHRRFVQAVEQLGLDKAVPSRILELMGIDCLTRHNIASHLQKYRSHRKHLLAREAEAASWSQRRQMYTGGGGGGCKREMSSSNTNSTSPWLAPTIGFPPMAPAVPNFRPLHVWGHPSMDQSLRHVWPKHLAPNSRISAPLPHSLWPPAAVSPHIPPPVVDPSFWQSRHRRVSNSLPPGTPFFPPPSTLAPTRFPAAPPVQGIPPHAMYKVDHPNPAGAGVKSTTAPAGKINCPNPPCDFHPSKESIDAALGDVLLKPWLPLPLGLKPPSADSVVVELHRQGIQNIPPTTST